MKKFILFARVNVWLTFALPLAASGQNADPYPNYVVIGAFAHQENAVEFTDDANKHNFPARFEMNPNRNLYYVYVLTTEDRKHAFDEALKLRTDTKYWDTWVYSGALGELGSQLTNAGGQEQDFDPVTGQTIGSVGLETNETVAGKTNLLSPEQRKDSGESLNGPAGENLTSDETDPNVNQPDNLTAKNTKRKGKKGTDRRNAQSGDEKNSIQTSVDGAALSENSLAEKNNTSETLQQPGVATDGKLVTDTNNSVTGGRSISDPNAETGTNLARTTGTQEQTGQNNLTATAPQDQQDNTAAKNTTRKGKKVTSANKKNTQTGDEQNSTATAPDGTVISENNPSEKINTAQTSQQPGVTTDGKLVTDTNNPVTGDKSISDPTAETGTNLARTTGTQEQTGQNNLTATAPQGQQDNTTAKNTTRKGKKITSGNKKNTQTGDEQKSTATAPDGTVIPENNPSEKDNTSQTSQQPGVTTDGKLVTDTNNPVTGSPVTGDKSISNPNAETAPGLNAKTLDQKSQSETAKTSVTENGLQSQPDNATAKNNTASGKKQTAGAQGNVQSGNEKKSTGAADDGSVISQNNLTPKNNTSQTSQQPGVNKDGKLSTANTDNSSTGEKSISDSNADAVTDPGLTGDPQKEETVSANEKNLSEPGSKVGSIENTEERHIPERASTDPLSSEDVAGKNFYFQLFRADNRRVVDGEVDAIDFEKSRRMATYQANIPVKIVMPAGKSKQVSFVSQVFGYRKMQKEFDPASPSEDLYLDKEGNLVVPFELARLQKGDIAIMYNVFFFKDAAVMRPESRYEVNNLLDLLNENPSYKIRIHGHTNGNASGKIIRMDKAENFYSLTNTKQGIGSAKLLSEERALVIREFLISSGVLADRMQVKAWGGKKPIHDKNSVRANENVRVEIEILSE